MMSESSYRSTSGFEVWRSWVTGAGLQPVILVAGSRGKTTVALLLDAMLRRAGLSVAVWTNDGVDIDGVRQKGELVPWQAVENDLDSGAIDIAIREVDWPTATTLATGPRVPMLAVTNVCHNREDCIAAGDAQPANAAMPALLTTVVGKGWLVLNGEDLAVSADLTGTDHNRLLVTMGLESPAIEEHLRSSGNLAWIVGDRIVISVHGQTVDLGSRFAIPFALDGKANFQIFNAMMAASLAVILGIDGRVIRETLTTFVSDLQWLPVRSSA